MAHSAHHSFGSQEAVTLGQALGLKPDVSVYASEHGLLVGDTNIDPPISLDKYLGELCASDHKPYFTPSQPVREALVLSLGYAYSTKMQQPLSEQQEPALHG